MTARNNWRKMYEQSQKDLRDCFGARQTIFHRCKCGRIAERGIICPSNQEKSGSCEDEL